MRFESLRLIAFGPFTDEVLDLSGGAPGGLHVVFGANEAGKSTSLRAVRSLLYGFDLRSRDAYLHPLPRLEIGATIAHEGLTYTVRRLKKRKDTLVDDDGNVLSESVLQKLLGHVDERTFASRLGLDQEELALGAEALLGGSEQGLFAAGTAGADVRRVLVELNKACGELFKKNGKNPRLNGALQRYQEALRFAADAVHPPEKWMEQKRHRDEADARVAELRSLRRALKEEHSRKSHLLSLLSDLSALAEVEARLSQLEGVVLLGKDASGERMRAEREQRDAQIELRQAEDAVTELSTALRNLGDPAPWGEVDDGELRLADRLGSGRQARADLPKRITELESLVDRLVQLAGALGLKVERARAVSHLQSLLPTAQIVRRANHLIVQEGKYRAELTAAQGILAELTEELGAAGQAGPEEECDGERLELALADGREARSDVMRYRDLSEKIERLNVRVARYAQQAGTDACQKFALPGDFSLERAVQADALWENLGMQERALQKSRRGLIAQTREIELRVKHLGLEGEAPTWGRVLEARALRDGALGAMGKEGVSVAAAKAELRELVEHADQLADRLRLDAGRVAQLEELEKEGERLALELSATERELDACQVEQQKLAAAWSGIFSAVGLREVAPGAWGAAARGLASAAEAHQERAELQAQQEHLATRLHRVRLELRSALGVVGTDNEATLGLLGLVDQAEASLDRLRRRQEREKGVALRRQERELAQGRAVSRLRTAQDALVAWQAQWRELLVALGQPEEANAETVSDVLVGFAELGRVLTDARSLEGRIAGIERDSARFADDLERIVMRHAPDLRGRDHLEIAEELKARISRSRAIEAERTRLTEEARRQKDKLAEAQRKFSVAQAELDAFVKAAGAPSVEELPHLEARSQERRELLEARSRLRKLVVDKSGGATVDHLMIEARAVQHNNLLAQVEELDERLEELEGELRNAETDAASLTQGLQLFASDRAAEARQSVVARQAEARELLRHYLVQKTAQTLLEREMSSYAERYSGPLAQRAGALLEILTLGAYKGLRVSAFDKTIGVISSKNSQEVEIQHLSRGTRAQLYFALRVASLEAYFQERSPVPLLLDDLFVDFDDDRTSAAFQILGELAKRVQILYFSHLARDVTLAHDAVPRGLVFDHTLRAA